MSGLAFEIIHFNVGGVFQRQRVALVSNMQKPLLQGGHQHAAIWRRYCAEWPDLGKVEIRFQSLRFIIIGQPVQPGMSVDFAVNGDSEVVIREADDPAGRTPDRFEAARGKADIRWRTDELMALLRDAP